MQLTGEYLVLKYPDRFTAMALAAATMRLDLAEADLPS
jgi:hypothetical protein